MYLGEWPGCPNRATQGKTRNCNSQNLATKVGMALAATGEGDEGEEEEAPLVATKGGPKGGAMATDGGAEAPGAAEDGTEGDEDADVAKFKGMLRDRATPSELNLVQTSPNI